MAEKGKSTFILLNVVLRRFESYLSQQTPFISFSPHVSLCFPREIDGGKELSPDRCTSATTPLGFSPRPRPPGHLTEKQTVRCPGGRGRGGVSGGGTAGVKPGVGGTKAVQRQVRVPLVPSGPPRLN